MEVGKSHPNEQWVNLAFLKWDVSEVVNLTKGVECAPNSERKEDY